MADEQPVAPETPTPTPPAAQPPQQPASKGGYGKRPIWQWVLLYVVIGGLIYFAIYYFFYRDNGGTGSGSSQHSLY